MERRPAHSNFLWCFVASSFSHIYMYDNCIITYEFVVKCNNVYFIIPAFHFFYSYLDFRCCIWLFCKFNVSSFILMSFDVSLFKLFCFTIVHTRVVFLLQNLFNIVQIPLILTGSKIKCYWRKELCTWFVGNYWVTMNWNNGLEVCSLSFSTSHIVGKLKNTTLCDVLFQKQGHQ